MSDQPLNQPQPSVPESQDAQASSETTPSPIDQFNARDLDARVVEMLRTVFDPEIPVNIYDLGLIYGVDATPEGEVRITMTLTSPMCPVAGSLPPEIEMKVMGVPGVSNVEVSVVWDPPWTPERMSEAAKLQLGML